MIFCVFDGASMYTVIKFQTETENNLGEQNVRWDFWFFLFTLKQSINVFLLRNTLCYIIMCFMLAKLVKYAVIKRTKFLSINDTDNIRTILKNNLA